MNTSRYPTVSLAALALALALAALVAPAPSISTAQALEEVLVTAQKREENLQDVPITVAAFTAEDLETLRINGIDDLGQYTPGLFSIPSPTDPSGLRLTLRGLVVNNPDIGVDNKVAIYQDGVYISKAVGTSFDLADLERVEILKGPQGTLYGRNAVAGAINLISKKASTEESGGSFDFTVGTYEEFRYRGSVNVAVSDILAFKVSAQSNQRAGWVENEGLGNDFNGYNKLAMRFDATLLPMDDVTVHYAYEKSDNEFEPAYFQPVVAANPAKNFGGTPSSLISGNRRDSAVSSVPTETGNLDTENHALTVQWDWSDAHAFKALFGHRYVNNSRTIYFYPESTSFPVVSGTLGYIHNGNATFAIPGWSTYDSLGALRAGTYARIPQGSEITSFASSHDQRDDLSDHRQYSLELTQTGSLDDLFGMGSLDYTAGFYYLNENSGNSNQDFVPSAGNANFDLLALAAIQSEAGLLGVLLNPSSTDEAKIAAIQGYVGALRASGASGAVLGVDTDAFALFGQATWTPTIPGMDFLEDRLHLTLGLRYSRDEKRGRLQKLSPIFYDTTDLAGNPIAPLVSEDTYDSFDPTFNLSYDVADDMMVYFSVGTAFLSGGYGAAAKTLDDFRFDKEKIIAYEVGFKGDLFDYVRLNAAGFFYDVSDQQQTITDPGNASINGVANADAEIFGFEIDLRANIPYVEGLSASVQYAYLDAQQENVNNPFIAAGEATEDNCSTGSGDRAIVSGTCVNIRGGAANPENTLSLGIDYQRDMDDLGVPGTLRAHLGYNFIDETNLTTNVPKDAVNLVDLRIALTDVAISDGSLDVALWFQNLLDDSYVVNRINFSTVGGGIGADLVNFGPPLTVGLDLKYTF